MEAKDRIIVALDTDDVEKAARIVELLCPHVGSFKFGHEFVHAMRANLFGPGIDRSVRLERFDAYLRLYEFLGPKAFDDVKFNDIPNTVAGGSRGVTRLGVRMFNVHCLGGRKMMQEAVRATRVVPNPPLVLGVTLLTSLDYDDLMETGIVGDLDITDPTTIDSAKQREIRLLVHRLAMLASSCGLDGVICSPQEAAQIRTFCRPGFLLVTPGIRDADSPPDDQKRTMTPAEAIMAGADMLVIGRLITGAKDPVAKAKQIAEQIDAALAAKQEAP